MKKQKIITVAFFCFSGLLSAQISLQLPVLPADTAFKSIGIWPFGVHGASHAYDGHPGLDIEFKVGTSVYAAASGTIQTLWADTIPPYRTTIQIMHGIQYRTVYTNISTLASGITVGAPVATGQELGTAGVQIQMIGPNLDTFAVIHFQLDDFYQNTGAQTNINAISPEAYLDPSSALLFNSMWKKSAYNQEFCEPFATNSRLTVFPYTRNWYLSGNGTIPQIKFSRQNPTTNNHEYAFYTSTVLSDSGTISNNAKVGSPFSDIDFISNNGGPDRLGIYDIVNDTMWLKFGNPGDPRPVDLSNASIYTTAAINSSVSDETANNFCWSVDPNPARGLFYISFPSAEIPIAIGVNYALAIQNVFGETIFSEVLSHLTRGGGPGPKNSCDGQSDSYEIDLSKYSRGIYLLTLRNQHLQQTKKVIIY